MQQISICLLTVDVTASGAELGRVLHLLRGEVYCRRGMLSPGAHFQAVIGSKIAV